MEQAMEVEALSGQALKNKQDEISQACFSLLNKVPEYGEEKVVQYINHLFFQARQLNVQNVPQDLVPLTRLIKMDSNAVLEVVQKLRQKQVANTVDVFDDFQTTILRKYYQHYTETRI